MDIINIILLGSGLYYAIGDDWNGDKHPNHDLISISIVAVISSFVFALMSQMTWPIDWSKFLIDFIRGGAMEAGWFIGLFNWLINLVLIKRGIIQLRLGEPWYNHFSKNAWPDKWPFWKNLDWRIRLAITGSAFIGGLIIYFLWS